MMEDVTPSEHGSSAAAACQFDGPWFGAGYPDAYCIDGYLHDADGDGYIEDDVSEPCPRCNTREFLARRKEDADSTVSMSWGSPGGMVTVTGDEIWERSKRWALQENPSEAPELIGRLETSAPGGSKASAVSEPVNALTGKTDTQEHNEWDAIRTSAQEAHLARGRKLDRPEQEVK